MSIDQFMLGTTCPSCRAFLENPSDVWGCAFCAGGKAVCDRCYVDHTSETHLRELYPDVVAKIEAEKKAEASSEGSP